MTKIAKLAAPKTSLLARKENFEKNMKKMSNSFL